MRHHSWLVVSSWESGGGLNEYRRECVEVVELKGLSDGGSVSIGALEGDHVVSS